MHRIRHSIFRSLVVLAVNGAIMLNASAASAASANIAVAANFTAPARELAAILVEETGHEAKLSFGATGAFYTQIIQGAPFDVLLAADAERPARLEAEGRIAPGSRFTYAQGRLALWSARPGFVDDRGVVLGKGDFDRLAIASPKLAPYGVAAVETLEKMGLAAVLQPKLVMGESIGQTYNFVATGNAELGFVALSQVVADQKSTRGSTWIVPDSFHAAIVQDAVILERGAGNPAAAAWVDLLRSPRGREVIRRFGYAVE